MDGEYKNHEMALIDLTPLKLAGSAGKANLKPVQTLKLLFKCFTKAHMFELNRIGSLFYNAWGIRFTE
jgi:hypothetical protein